jgi:hypothetical protein
VTCGTCFSDRWLLKTREIAPILYAGLRTCPADHHLALDPGLVLDLFVGKNVF